MSKSNAIKLALELQAQGYDLDEIEFELYDNGLNALQVAIVLEYLA